ncbi:MAG: hypothetical protein HYR80_08775, partial [Nitrospirae bacterium]|nr:hypothetical protein [Nitrospirota bacterium]
KAMEAPIYRLGVDFNYHTQHREDCFANSLDYHGIHQSNLNFVIPLLGEHQRRNASLALAALELLNLKGFPHPESAKRKGLLQVRWPGRIEIVQSVPLILLDGAHNPAGASNLARFLTSLPQTGRRYLVLGIMKDKDIWGIGERLIPWADEIILTQASYSRAATPGELLRTLRRELQRPSSWPGILNWR